MAKVRKITFLVWAPYSPRAENLSQQLGARLYLMSYKFRKKIYSPIKYSVLLLRTLYALRMEKPDIIVCQTPPIFCSLSVLLYRYLSGRKKVRLIIDMHSAALDKLWRIFKILDKFVMKRASMVIVTNVDLQHKLSTDYGIESLILNDKIPIYHNANLPDDKSKFQSGFSVAIISSFASDEPIEEILHSAMELPDVQFYITGNKERLGNKHRFKHDFHKNIIFTGFLPQHEYVSILRKVDAIIALTTRGMTTLCGGYEAIALEKPLITSNSASMVAYFNKGTIYVNNSVSEIKEAIRSAQVRKEELTMSMRILKEEKTKEWGEDFHKFNHLLLRDSITFDRNIYNMLSSSTQ